MRVSLLSAALIAATAAGCASRKASAPVETPAQQAQTANTAAPLPYLDKLPPLVDRERFFEDPVIAGGQLSPDGRFISFVKPYKGVMNVWVKGIDQPFDAARPLTADLKRPLTSYFWSRNGEWVLFRQDKGGDENFHVYAVSPSAPADAATGVPPARDLTPGANVRAEIIAVPKGDPENILVGMNDRKPQVHDVYRVNLKSGKRTLVFQNDANIAGWVADLSGKLRLGLRRLPDGSTEILRVEGKKLAPKPLYTCGNEETCGPARFHKDGKRIYLVTNKGDRDLIELGLLDTATGKVEHVERDPEGKVDLAGPMFSTATDELVATAYVDARQRIYPKEERFKKDYEALQKLHPEGDVDIVSSTLDDNLWLVSVDSDVDPGAVYLYRRGSGKTELLYRPYPNLPREALAQVKPVTYKARDGLDIHGYLTLPKGVEPKALATVMLIHGGPWARDHWGYNPVAQFLANRGYAVLQPNFRGSTGYGKRHLNLGNKQWGTGSMQHDITDGVKWLAESGIADARKVAIMGGSYGGYATLAGLAFTPDVYAAGVDIVGPSNIVTLLNSIPPYWAPIQSMFKTRVGDLQNPEELERLKAQSPLHSAKQIRSPLLVIQGANDPRVKQAESDQIVSAMHALGRPVKYLVAEDEGHGYRGVENRMAMNVEIERFLHKHLGGRVQESVKPEIAERLSELTVDPASVKAPEEGASTPASSK